MAKEKLKNYVYILQLKSETRSCKIGIAEDLEARFNDYKNTTGVPKDAFHYLFTCKVKDGRRVENDIKKEFGRLREKDSREIYLCNDNLFEEYVNYIKSHKLFIEEKEIAKQSRLISSVKLERSTLTLLLNCSGLAPLQLRVGVL